MPPFPGDISYKIKLIKVNCIWNVKLFKITRVVLKYLKGRVRIISLSTLQGWTSVVKNESYWLRKGKLRISNKGSWSQEINHCNGAAAWPDSYSHLKSLPLVDSSFTATRLVMWINLKNWKKQPFRFWVLTDHCLVQSSNHIWTFHIPHSTFSFSGSVFRASPVTSLLPSLWLIPQQLLQGSLIFSLLLWFLKRNCSSYCFH